MKRSNLDIANNHFCQDSQRKSQPVAHAASCTEVQRNCLPCSYHIESGRYAIGTYPRRISCKFGALAYQRIRQLRKERFRTGMRDEGATIIPFRLSLDSIRMSKRAMLAGSLASIGIELC